MKTIPLVATSEKLDMKRNTLTYTTDVNTKESGIIVLVDSEGDRDMMVANQLHSGGPVSVVMKPIKMPAKKYNVGETVGHLIVF